MTVKYTKSVPTLISNNVSNYDEAGRWVLDWNNVLYKDESHAPGFYVPYVNKASGQTGNFNGPVYLSRETMIYKSISIADYFETKCTPERRLFPDDEEGKTEVRKLEEYYHLNVESPVANIVYFYILPHREFAVPLFTKKIPKWEQITIRLIYKKFSQVLYKALQLHPGTPQEALAIVRKEFDKVEALLSDGRKYLTGERFTAADIMLGANTAPILMPPNYGGSGPHIDQVPDELRKITEELRATAAGQFVLRLYKENRPAMRSQSEIPENERGQSVKVGISGFLHLLNS